MSMRFDGTNDYLVNEAATLLNYNSDYTIMGKVFAEDVAALRYCTCLSGATGSPFNDLDALAIAENATPNKLGLEVEVAGAYTTNVGTTTISPSVWYDFAMVRSGTTVTVYINGVSETSVTVSITGRPATARHVLAAWTSFSNKFQGRLYHWVAWSVAKSQATIDAQRQVWPPTDLTSIYGYWPLANGTDTSDGSGNGHVWTIGGAPTTAGNPGAPLFRGS